MLESIYNFIIHYVKFARSSIFTSTGPISVATKVSHFWALNLDCFLMSSFYDFFSDSLQDEEFGSPIEEDEEDDEQ